MTCIAGLLDNGKIYMGADSCASNGYCQAVRADHKVFKNHAFLIGFTGSFRAGQLLRYGFTPPKYNPEDDVYEYLVTSFINGVRSCLKKGGVAEKDKEVEKGIPFLLGFRGRLFRVHSDYQVAEAIEGFDACGSGEELALGSFFSTRGKPPKERIITALKAAQQFNPHVREPFIVLKS